MQNLLGAIGVTFDRKDRNDVGVKVGIWQLDGFTFRFTVVDQSAMTYRVVVSQPSRDGFTSPTRDVTVRLGQRLELLEVFTISSGMRAVADDAAKLVDAFVRAEFFVRAPAETVILSN